MGFSILIQRRQDRISKIEKVFDIVHSMSLHFVDISTVNELTILSVRYSNSFSMLHSTICGKLAKFIVCVQSTYILDSIVFS